MQSLLSIIPLQETQAKEVETAAKAFRDLAIRHNQYSPVIILRAGEMGSYTLDSEEGVWVPAYWTKEEQVRVVDPTGGGNAFCGGLCAGLLLSDGDFRIGTSNTALKGLF